jgi:hypothetical protein
LEGSRLENVDIFYTYLEYFTDIGDILQPFDTVCVHLVHFPLLVSFTKINLATLVSNIFHRVGDSIP